MAVHQMVFGYQTFPLIGVIHDLKTYYLNEKDEFINILDPTDVISYLNHSRDNTISRIKQDTLTTEVKSFALMSDVVNWVNGVDITLITLDYTRFGDILAVVKAGVLIEIIKVGTYLITSDFSKILCTDVKRIKKFDSTHKVFKIETLDDLKNPVIYL